MCLVLNKQSDNEHDEDDAEQDKAKVCAPRRFHLLWPDSRSRTCPYQATARPVNTRTPAAVA